LPLTQRARVSGSTERRQAWNLWLNGGNTLMRADQSGKLARKRCAASTRRCASSAATKVSAAAAGALSPATESSDFAQRFRARMSLRRMLRARATKSSETPILRWVFSFAARNHCCSGRSRPRSSKIRSGTVAPVLPGRNIGARMWRCVGTVCIVMRRFLRARRPYRPTPSAARCEMSPPCRAPSPR